MSISVGKVAEGERFHNYLLQASALDPINVIGPGKKCVQIKFQESRPTVA